MLVCLFDDPSQLHRVNIAHKDSKDKGEALTIKDGEETNNESERKESERKL